MIKGTYKTLELIYFPLGQAAGGIVTIDIGKYFDNNSVRIVKVWGHAEYTDITAGASEIAADMKIQIRDTTVMRIPNANITAVPGFATNTGFPVVPTGAESGEYAFLGDLILESPSFRLDISGYKKSPGVYPMLFNFIFDIVVVFEFNFDDLK